MNQWGCSCTVDVKISCTQLHYKHKVSLYLSLITHMQIWKSALQEFPRGVFSAWYDFNSSLVGLGIWIICELFQNCLRPSSPVIDQWTGIMNFFMQLFFLTQTPLFFLISELPVSDCGNCENETPPPLPPHPSEDLLNEDHNHRLEFIYFSYLQPWLLINDCDNMVLINFKITYFFAKICSIVFTVTQSFSISW